MLLAWLFWIAASSVNCVKLCEDNGEICPPVLNHPEIFVTDNYDDDQFRRLNSTPKSGCFCKEYPKYTICFGRYTCISTPTKINITTNKLIIKGSAIQSIKETELDWYKDLLVLQIEHNEKLTDIASGSFRALSNLTHLSISFNKKLNFLRKHIFDGLVNLKELTVENNGLSSIRNVAEALPPFFFPNLKKLNLKTNVFYSINKNDFQPMLNSSIEELVLDLCQIRYIHPKAFLPLGNLTVLKLGQNNFNASVLSLVIEAGVSKIPLRYLDLSSIDLRETPPVDLMTAIAKSDITHLILARNKFELIWKDSFPFMPNLKYLDLTEVLALNITNDAFINLPNLRTLLLRRNKLLSIPTGVLLPNLTYLDIRQNCGDEAHPSYFSIGSAQFYNMKNLRQLEIGYNRMNVITRDTFIGLVNLQNLFLQNSSIYYIGNNSFIYLKNLELLDLQNNFFFRNRHHGFNDIFRGLDNLKQLFLGGNSITFLSNQTSPFANLPKLTYLGLERNKIITLSELDFLPLINLKHLDLSENLIQPWTKPVFKTNKLQSLILSRNKIKYLTEACLEDFEHLESIDLSRNAFSCDCLVYEDYSNWISKNPNSTVLKKLKKLPPKCYFPESTVNYNYVSYIEMVQKSSLCRTDLTEKLLLSLPLVFVLFIFAALVFTIYLYRWHVRYWIFLARLYLSRKGKIKPKSNKYFDNYQYDAFVSYSNEDRNFVIRLVSMLENYEPFLKLCVYERDFEIGSFISESVLENVAKSRRTLLIISDNYAKSQWCRWESQIAEHHRLFFHDENGEYVDDSLILIKLGAVSKNHLTPTLKYLLKTRIYLAWDQDEAKQKSFWEKLRNALRPPAVPESTHM